MACISWCGYRHVADHFAPRAMSRASGVGASARCPPTVACDDSWLAGLEGCSGVARRHPSVLSPDALAEAVVRAPSPPPTFADTLASIVARAASPPTGTPATGGWLPDVVPRPPTTGGGWQANGRRYVVNGGNKSDLRHTDHRGYSSLEDVLHGEASAGKPRTPAVLQKRMAQTRKLARKPVKPSTERRRSIVSCRDLNAPTHRRQSVVAKGGFLWRADDEDGDPEEEAKALMAKNNLRSNFLSADWTTVLESAADKMTVSRPVESEPKTKAGEVGFGSDPERPRRRVDAQFRQQDRPETAAEKPAAKESLFPGVYCGHGQLRVPIITPAGVQANMPLIDGGIQKSARKRWHSKFNDRDVTERESVQGGEVTSGWYQKPPVGAKQQLAEVELPPEEPEDGHPKEEDRKEYLKWRKKVIECARSMALEVDRFRSVVQ